MNIIQVLVLRSGRKGRHGGGDEHTVCSCLFWLNFVSGLWFGIFFCLFCIEVEHCWIDACLRLLAWGNTSYYWLDIVQIWVNPHWFIWIFHFSRPVGTPFVAIFGERQIRNMHRWPNHNTLIIDIIRVLQRSRYHRTLTIPSNPRTRTPQINLRMILQSIQLQSHVCWQVGELADRYVI